MNFVKSKHIFSSLKCKFGDGAPPISPAWYFNQSYIELIQDFASDEGHIFLPGLSMSSTISFHQ